MFLYKRIPRPSNTDLCSIAEDDGAVAALADLPTATPASQASVRARIKSLLLLDSLAQPSSSRSREVPGTSDLESLRREDPNLVPESLKRPAGSPNSSAAKKMMNEDHSRRRGEHGSRSS